MRDADELQFDLHTNRVIYWLDKGVLEENLDAARIGVSPSELPAVIEAARKRLKARPAMEATYLQSERQSGLWIALFGVVMLALAIYLSSGNIPSGRYGRLIVSFALGGGALLYGLIKMTFPRLPH